MIAHYQRANTAISNNNNSSSSNYPNEDIFDGLITPSLDKSLLTDEVRGRPAKFLGANLKSWLILLLIIAIFYLSHSRQSFVDYTKLESGPDLLVAAVYSGAGNVKG